MTTTINAVASTGLVQTSDGSGILNVQSNGVNTNAQAWAHITGGATPVINASYNCSSVTRVGAGNYTLNFTNAFVDANYSAVVCANGGNTNGVTCGFPVTATTSTLQLFFTTFASQQDPTYFNVAVFR